MSWQAEGARSANQRMQSLAISLALFPFYLAQASASQQGKSKTKEFLFGHPSRASELGSSGDSILLWGPAKPTKQLTWVQRSPVRPSYRIDFIP